MKKGIIIEATIILYVVLFLYTGISKLMEHSVFKEQISSSPILAPISNFLSIALPITELLIVLLLIIPRWKLKGLYASLILMIIFTIYILAILAINDKLPCSCGGIISLLSWHQHLILNTAFICLAAFAIYSERQKRDNRKDGLALYSRKIVMD